MQAHLCVFPCIRPGLISSFCSTLLGGWLLRRRRSELIRRLTCFTTIDHWPTFQLHKNTLFYKSPSDDTRQEKGVRLRNERSQANGARHRRPKQGRGASQIHKHRCLITLLTYYLFDFSPLLLCWCQVFHYRLFSHGFHHWSLCQLPM